MFSYNSTAMVLHENIKPQWETEMNGSFQHWFVLTFIEVEHLKNSFQTHSNIRTKEDVDDSLV